MRRLKIRFVCYAGRVIKVNDPSQGSHSISVSGDTYQLNAGRAPRIFRLSLLTSVLALAINLKTGRDVSYRWESRYCTNGLPSH